MRSELGLTLVALVSLGGRAAADTDDAPTRGAETITVDIGSPRGVAQDYLVLPSGAELTAQMRFITADPIGEAERLKFTDLALFELAGRWAVWPRLELSGSIDLVPKQPSYTDEKPWQSVRVAVRTPFGRRAAVALSGGGGHLMSHAGMWTGGALTVDWKKPIHRHFLSFDVQGGVNGLGLHAPDELAASAFFTEVSVNTTALFREPTGHWGAWLGIGYAVPVYTTGHDPTTGLDIDPQPRLDFRMGTVWSVDAKWDLFVDLAVVDRGDAADPATRLPILGGGFDQRQVIFGVTRHVERTGKDRVAADPLQLGQR